MQNYHLYASIIQQHQQLGQVNSNKGYLENPVRGKSVHLLLLHYQLSNQQLLQTYTASQIPLCLFHLVSQLPQRS